MKPTQNEGPGNGRAIEMKLTRTSFLTRWPCHICGGETEKDQVLCEAEICDDAELPDGTIRVCAECLAARNIDERLKRTAKMYEDWAVMTRGLIGGS
jgi:hypothetical protein